VKIRSQIINKLVGLLGACFVRSWLATVRYKLQCFQPQLDPGHPAHTGRYIYAFWHESIFALAGMRKIRNMAVLISRHNDGEMITQIVQRLGASVVRGSSTRGGRAALRGLLAAARVNHLLITPDGPRGPRRQLQSGALFLAAHSGLPIVPVGFGFTRVWRARSWDRFALPLPYSQVTCVVGAPIAIPSHLPAESLEQWRVRVQQRLLQCTDRAERWASKLEQEIGGKRAA
jgi:hypothetical protein